MARIHGCVLVALIVLLPLATCGTVPPPEVHILSWKDYDGTDKDFKKAPELYDQCIEQKVCAQTKNYPRDLAKWILKKLKTERNTTSFTNEKKHTVIEDVTHSLCESKERILPPEAAVSTDEKVWHFILNLNLHEVQRDPKKVPQYFQEFYVNICTKQGEPCSDVFIFSGGRQETRCEQKYASKQMMYLDLEKKFVGVKSFQVPICCSCKI